MESDSQNEEIVKFAHRGRPGWQHCSSSLRGANDIPSR
jgi:hypothetical protein